MLRALFGSLRLTKDIDLERAPTLSGASLRNTLPRALKMAALGAGLLGPEVAITKDSPTTLRASLAAALRQGGERIRYEM